MCVKNDGNTSPKNFSLNTIDEYVEVMKKVGQCIRINSSERFIDVNNKERLDICGAGRKSLSINPYGDVFPCNSLLIKCGNVRQQKIVDIWNNNLELKKIRNYTMDKVEGCQGCHHINYCSFCPGNALLETGNPLKKYSDACVANEARKKYIEGGKNDETT